MFAKKIFACVALLALLAGCTPPEVASPESRPAAGVVISKTLVHATVKSEIVCVDDSLGGKKTYKQNVYSVPERFVFYILRSADFCDSRLIAVISSRKTWESVHVDEWFDAEEHRTPGYTGGHIVEFRAERRQDGKIVQESAILLDGAR